ncbi:MAG: hypothetical protein WEB88_16850 [Gemmatimonadota bacterium]
MLHGSRILTGGVLAVIGLITVKVVLALFGVVATFVSFMLFTVLPIALVVGLVVWLVRYMRRKPAEV